MGSFLLLQIQNYCFQTWKWMCWPEPNYQQEKKKKNGLTSSLLCSRAVMCRLYFMYLSKPCAPFEIHRWVLSEQLQVLTVLLLYWIYCRVSVSCSEYFSLLFTLAVQKAWQLQIIKTKLIKKKNTKKNPQLFLIRSFAGENGRNSSNRKNNELWLTNWLMKNKNHKYNNEHVLSECSILLTQATYRPRTHLAHQ